jgi:hypothetical protein
VKIIILSILAVAMIGLMVPSAFAEPIWHSEAGEFVKTSCGHKSVTMKFEDWKIKQGDGNYKVIIINGYATPNKDHLERDDCASAPVIDYVLYIEGERYIHYDYVFDDQGNKFTVSDSPKYYPSMERIMWDWQDYLEPVDFKLRYEVPSSVTKETPIDLYYTPEFGYDRMINHEYKLGELQQLSVSTQTTSSGSSGGGCLIATAAFGSEMAPQVQFLRELRDNTVLQTQSGTTFMTGFNQFYYSFSPAVADYERDNPVFKEAVKLTLTPLLTSLAILNYVDIDTEQEMLGYGIGVILLNIGMYFVAPAVVIISLKKRFKF